MDSLVLELIKRLVTDEFELYFNSEDMSLLEGTRLRQILSGNLHTEESWEKVVCFLQYLFASL